MSFNIRILARKGEPIVGDARIPPTRDTRLRDRFGCGREAATPVGSTAGIPDQVGPTLRGDTWI